MNKYVMFYLTASFYMLSCSTEHDKGLLGKWHRQYNDSTNQILRTQNPHWGDITFSNDSTYFIEGDNQSGFSKDTISGWHIGEQKRGIFSVSKNDLQLKPIELEKTFFTFNYKIIELTDEKLVLKFTLDSDHSANQITYLRHK